MADGKEKNSMIKFNFSLFTIACFLFAISSCGNNSSEKSSESKKSPAQAIFEENCTSCHGSDGKLGVLGAKDLSISTLDKTQMTEIITNGKNTMTPFGSMLSKEQIDAVADYVQTFKK